MTQVTANGVTYSDDGTASADMRNGGHRTYLLQMLSNVMVVINNLLGGTWVTNVTTKTGTGAQTVAASDHIILWNPGTPADATFTLPASPAVGQRHRFKHRQTTGQIFTLTAAPTAGTIDGVASVSLQIPNGELKLVHLGSDDWTVEDPPGSPAPRKNLLVNGAMQIDQANEGTSVALASTVAAYAADQWQVLYISTASGVTAQWVTDSPDGFNHSVKLTVGTGAAVGAGHLLTLLQPIPTTHIVGTGIGTATAQLLYLSFWVKSSIATYVASGALQTPAANRSYPFNFKITAANTWERKVIAIPGDTSGTWTSASGKGAILSINPAVGSTFQGTANTWAASNVVGTALNTNTVLSTSGATFQVAAVKLEASPAPTAFEPLSAPDEIDQCARFYEKSYSLGTALGGVTTAGACLVRGSTMGATTGASIRFATPKRGGAPTITMYSTVTGASAKVRDVVAGADVTPTTGWVGGGGFAFTAVMGGANVNLETHWVADARY